jgi:hypothetical protein
LCHAALKHRVHQQHITPFYVGPPTESYFAPSVAFMFDVAYVLSNKVANRRSIDMSYQVCPEYKPSVQRNHYIQPFTLARSGNLPA